MHKVVTLCSANYFQYAKYFISTRNKVKAKFFMYGPDLTPEQIKILEDHSIEYIQVNQEDFDTKMQTMKFSCMQDQIDLDNPDELITFVDADTFFVKDWNPSVSRWKFDIGITARNDMIDIGCSRAYANGGVIFAKNTTRSIDILKFAYDTCLLGKSDSIPEYDEIWKTLEDPKRPAHKRHFRTNLRCWTDQVFLSSLIAHRLKTSPNLRSKDSISFTCSEWMVFMFNSRFYNRLEDSLGKKVGKGVYIKHLKQTGRTRISGKKENLLGA